MNAAPPSVQLMKITGAVPLVKMKDGIRGEPIAANVVIAKI